MLQTAAVYEGSAGSESMCVAMESILHARETPFCNTLFPENMIQEALLEVRGKDASGVHPASGGDTDQSTLWLRQALAILSGDAR